jgi:hypothetical protein
VKTKSDNKSVFKESLGLRPLGTNSGWFAAVVLVKVHDRSVAGSSPSNENLPTNRPKSLANGSRNVHNSRKNKMSIRSGNAALNRF